MPTATCTTTARWPGGRSATWTTRTTCCTRWAQSTISTTRPTSSSGAASWASTRPASCPPKATGGPAGGRRRLSCRPRCSPWWTAAGRSTGYERARGRAARAGSERELPGPRDEGRAGRGAGTERLPGEREVTAAGPGVAPRPGRVRAFLRLVVIEHSVFALPFAYVAALTAMAPDVRWLDLLLVTVAMVAGRTFALAANRVIDRKIDARNPRTAGRELVTGAVSVRTAVVGALVALAVPLATYPYAKRVTDYPHVVLGLAQAAAPVGAWLAVTGSWTRPSVLPAVVLGLAVGSWIGGFDLIYACQDAE